MEGCTSLVKAQQCPKNLSSGATNSSRTYASVNEAPTDDATVRDLNCGFPHDADNFMGDI